MKINSKICICIFVMFLMCGCVYLRLGKLKKQLKEFDKYFEIREDRGLELISREPVLTSDDIRILIDEPTKIVSENNREYWYWTFKKVYEENQAEDKNYDFTFIFYIERGKLKSITIPEEFCVILPKNFIVFLLKSFGNAKVDRKNKTASIEEHNQLEKFELPEYDNIVELLGIPCTNENNEKELIYSYKYYLYNMQIPVEDCKKATAEFRFTLDKERLLSMKNNFAGINVVMEFQ